MLYVQSTVSTTLSAEIIADATPWTQEIWHVQGGCDSTNKCYGRYDKATTGKPTSWPVPDTEAALEISYKYAFGEGTASDYVAYRFDIHCPDCANAIPLSFYRGGNEEDTAVDHRDAYISFENADGLLETAFDAARIECIYDDE